MFFQMKKKVICWILVNLLPVNKNNIANEIHDKLKKNTGKVSY